MLKTDPKKDLSQIYGFSCSSRYNDLTFYEKKISHFTIPLKKPKQIIRSTNIFFNIISRLHFSHKKKVYLQKLSFVD